MSSSAFTQPPVYIHARASRSALTNAQASQSVFQTQAKTEIQTEPVAQQQQLRAQLTQQQSALSLEQHWIKDQALWVGAYKGELCESIPEALQPYDSRNLRFALTTLADMEQDVREHVAQFAPHRLAIVVGTSTSGISDNEALMRDYFHRSAAMQAQQLHADAGADVDAAEGTAPRAVDALPKISQKKQEMDALANALQLYMGWTGLCYSISTACSSSAKAMATAQRLLNADLADAVLVAGVDTLSQLTLNGFHSLENLSRSICRPCGEQRDGINIGEAASLFLLSKQPADLMLVAAGESMDAWHISAPHPEGRGAIAAMQSALQQAGLNADQIDYLNLHGTATTHNDDMEIKAVRQVFGAHPIALSSTKHQTGHCLGAAGALEAYICTQVLADQDWLPLHHAGQIDAALADRHYVGAQQSAGDVPKKTRLNYVMSNSFAFGGSNISLIFGRNADES